MTGRVIARDVVLAHFLLISVWRPLLPGRSAVPVPVREIPVRKIRVGFLCFPKLFLGLGAIVFGLFLAAAGLFPEPLGLEFGLLRIGLRPSGLDLALACGELVGLGLLTHFRGLGPIGGGFAFTADEDCNGCDRQNDDDADN